MKRITSDDGSVIDLGAHMTPEERGERPIVADPEPDVDIPLPDWLKDESPPATPPETPLETTPEVEPEVESVKVRVRAAKVPEDSVLSRYRGLPPEDDVLNDRLDKLVECWHNEPEYVGPLHEYLGMTWQEYKDWTGPDKVVPPSAMLELASRNYFEALAQIPSERRLWALQRMARLIADQPTH